MERPTIEPERLAVWHARLTTPAFRCAHTIAESPILCERYYAGVWLFEELLSHNFNCDEAKVLVFNLGAKIASAAHGEVDPWEEAQRILNEATQKDSLGLRPYVQPTWVKTEPKKSVKSIKDVPQTIVKPSNIKPTPNKETKPQQDVLAVDVDDDPLLSGPVTLDINSPEDFELVPREPKKRGRKAKKRKAV